MTGPRDVKRLPSSRIQNQAQKSWDCLQTSSVTAPPTKQHSGLQEHGRKNDQPGDRTQNLQLTTAIPGFDRIRNPDRPETDALTIRPVGHEEDEEYDRYYVARKASVPFSRDTSPVTKASDQEVRICGQEVRNVSMGGTTCIRQLAFTSHLRSGPTGMSGQ